MKIEFTSESLPQAIKKLLELNNYEVIGPIQIHGAEVDLKATSLSDPFSSPIYIEATLEYVRNTKYGNDLSKLLMISELEPDAKKMIISSKGFSLPVKERAKKSRIYTLTYEQLFEKFEKFEPYISLLNEATTLGKELLNLDSIYEEPFFNDQIGNDQATSYLTSWRDNPAPENKWIVSDHGVGGYFWN